jgi:hypothetical protein
LKENKCKCKAEYSVYLHINTNYKEEVAIIDENNCGTGT